MRMFISVAACVLAFLPSVARATPTEFVFGAGPSMYATTWRGDVGAGGTLRAGVRFSRVFAIDFQGWESYATVNRRLNTGLSLGIAGYLPLMAVRPFARVFALHQHEEAIISAQNAPVGVLFGVGPGIRHRAGGGLTLGIEVPMKHLSPRVEPAFALNTNATWFPDPLGPNWYFGIDVGVALDIGL